MKRLLLLTMSATFATAQLSASSLATYVKEQLPLSNASMAAAIVGPAALCGLVQAMRTPTRTVQFPRTPQYLCNLPTEEIVNKTITYESNRLLAYYTQKVRGAMSGIAFGSALSLCGGTYVWLVTENKNKSTQAKKIMGWSSLGVVLGLGISHLIGDLSQAEKNHYALALEESDVMINNITFNATEGHYITVDASKDNKNTLVARLWNDRTSYVPISLGTRNFCITMIGKPQDNIWKLISTDHLQIKD